MKFFKNLFGIWKVNEQFREWYSYLCWYSKYPARARWYNRKGKRNIKNVESGFSDCWKWFSVGIRVTKNGVKRFWDYLTALNIVPRIWSLQNVKIMKCGFHNFTKRELYRFCNGSLSILLSSKMILRKD